MHCIFESTGFCIILIVDEKLSNLLCGPDQDIVNLDIGWSLDDMENTVSNVFGLQKKQEFLYRKQFFFSGTKFRRTLLLVQKKILVLI